MKLLNTIGLLLIIANLSMAQSLASKLGYSEDDKLLIIHADDLGVSHSENDASFTAMKMGMVNSASIMMPTPWVEEVAAFSQKYPEADLGLHLTLTSEWKYIKWSPIASKDKVSSIVNEKGFLYDNCLDFGQNANPAEAELEIRAQVEQALKMGIKPTHLDTHMGCLVFNSPELFEAYLKVGREYKIPVMVGRLFLKAASPAFKEKITKDDIIIESILSASAEDYTGDGLAAYYRKTLNDLGTGVNVLLIHLAYNDNEMQALSVDHPLWGADWRQQDFNFFTSKECKVLLDKNNIKLVTWREIQKVMY